MTQPANPPVPAPAPTPPAPAPAPPAAPPPARPDGVSEAEWAALGDPGKAALVRERQRATAAEQALAAAQRPPAPAPAPAPAPVTPSATDRNQTGGQPAPADIATIVQQAVQAAVAPIQQAQAQAQAEAAAATITQAVTQAAGDRFHDPSDALRQIDLTQVTDGTGRPDATKINAALDAVLTAKPYLGKPADPRRFAQPGGFVGSTPPAPAAGLDDRVKATLAQMQQAAGVKLADF